MRRLQQHLVFSFLLVTFSTTGYTFADHAIAEQSLRIQFDRELADLETDYRIRRERLEQSRRNALAQIDIGRQQARLLQEPRRTYAMRELDNQSREISIQFRSRRQQLDAETELRRNRLRYERDLVLAQLRDQRRASFRPGNSYILPQSQPLNVPRCGMQQGAQAGFTIPIDGHPLGITELIEAPAVHYRGHTRDVQIPLGRAGYLRIEF